MQLETKGAEHCEQVLGALRGQGYALVFGREPRPASGRCQILGRLSVARVTVIRHD